MMEKKTSFGSLIYREYCITKMSAAGNILCFVMFYVICIMYTLSARFGNVAKAAANPELSDLIAFMTPTVRMMGIMVSFMAFMSAAESSSADLKNKTWRLYRKSSPASPFRLAMARTVYQLITFAVSVCLSLFYLFTDSLAGGSGISRGDIGIMAAISALIVLMSVSMTVCVEFMRSINNGMIIAMGILFAAAMAIMLPNSSGREPMTIDEFTAKFELLADKAPLLIAAEALLFVIEAVLLTLLYKRRDK